MCIRDSRFTSNEGSNDCNGCSDGTFTEDAGQSICRNCPTMRAKCENGRLALEAKTWYPLDTTKQLGKETEIHECFNDECCVLYNVSTRVRCDGEKGYYGPVCGACNRDNGAMRSGKACAFCWHSEANASASLGLGVLLLVFIVYLVVQHNFDVSPDVYVGTVQKLGLSFLQMLGVLGVFKARGTAVFNEVMSRPSEVLGGSFSSLLPLKCLMGSQSYGPFFVNMMLPIVILVLAMIIPPTACLSLRRRRLQ